MAARISEVMASTVVVVAQNPERLAWQEAATYSRCVDAGRELRAPKWQKQLGIKEHSRVYSDKAVSFLRAY